MQLEDYTPSHVQAIKMRKFSEEGRLIFNMLVLVSAVKITDWVVREMMRL